VLKTSRGPVTEGVRKREARGVDGTAVVLGIIHTGGDGDESNL
jgi:hypothetical protein